MPGKLLLVRGDRAKFRRLAFALGQQGHEIITTTSSQEGLMLLDEVSPNMIIMDATVPNSMRTCARIRELVNIPIILMGSDSPQKAWEQAVEVGADAYLSVFTDPGELVATVHSILRRYQKMQNQLSS